MDSWIEMEVVTAENKKQNLFILLMKKTFKFIRNFFKKDCCKILLLIFSLLLTTKILFAQDMPGMNMPKDTTKKSKNMNIKKDTMKHSMGMDMPMDSMNMKMSS